MIYEHYMHKSGMLKHSLSGFFIYLESSNIPPGAVFRLISVKLTVFGPPPYLLTFWYHMYGKTMGSLSVREVYEGQVYGKSVWIDSGGVRNSKTQQKATYTI